MKTRIFNLIIIDESGSMRGIKREAIENVNETIFLFLVAKIIKCRLGFPLQFTPQL